MLKNISISKSYGVITHLIYVVTISRAVHHIIKTAVVPLTLMVVIWSFNLLSVEESCAFVCWWWYNGIFEMLRSFVELFLDLHNILVLLHWRISWELLFRGLLTQSFNQECFRLLTIALSYRVFFFFFILYAFIIRVKV